MINKKGFFPTFFQSHFCLIQKSQFESSPFSRLGHHDFVSSQEVAEGDPSSEAGLPDAHRLAASC